MEKRKAPARLPRFKSREEEAEFWDTHDTTKYFIEEVEVKFADDLKFSYAFETDPKTLDAIMKRAKQRGVPVNDLISEWVREGLARTD